MIVNRPILSCHSAMMILSAMGTCYIESLIDENIKGYTECSIDGKEFIIHITSKETTSIKIDRDSDKLKSAVIKLMGDGFVFFTNHVNIIKWKIS